MATLSKVIENLRQQFREVSAEKLQRELQSNPPVLVDVRERQEQDAGQLPGALSLPKSFLEVKAGEILADKDADIVVYCAGGTRSLLAARALSELGYKNVRSLEGGFGAWVKAGGNAAKENSLTASQAARYARHLNLSEVGEEGQRLLLDSRVLVVGAGGLGSPALLYLAAAGVGTLGIIDDDVVDASNLQRQVLHRNDRVGQAKVKSARETLLSLNPGIKVETYGERLDAKNASSIVQNYQVLIDGTDNFASRYLLNDAALQAGIPVVHASIYKFEGQLAVFSATGRPCYRCLFPEPPPANEAPNCGEAGVLGVLPGVLGVLQATEAIKFLLGAGRTMEGRLLLYDALEASFRELAMRENPNCVACGPQA